MLLGKRLPVDVAARLNRAVSSMPSEFDWHSFRGVQRDCRDTCKTGEHLVAFVAVGQKRHYVLESIRRFDGWDCLVFVHSQRRISSRCMTVRRKWPWISFLRYMTPVRVAKYDTVTIVLDDVDMLQYDPRTSIAALEQYNANIVTPRVAEAHFHGMIEAVKRAIVLNFTEIFFTTFDRNAWSCFWSMTDRIVAAYPESVGWGYDVCFPAFCPHLKHVSVPFWVRHSHIHANSENRHHAHGENEMAALRDMTRKLVHRTCLNATEAL